MKPSFFDCLVPDFVSEIPSATIMKMPRRKTRRGKKKKVVKSAKWTREFNEAMIEQKQMKKIPYMSYKLYMGSAYWKKRKLLYFNKHGKQCAVCKVTSGVTLHHKIYDNKLNGKEPDDHFVALCQFHHQQFHDNHQLMKNMQKDTDIFVGTMKQMQVSGIDDLSWIE